MTLANWLTSVRLLLSPVFVLVFLQEGLWARIAALAIVVVSELTDAFDGHLARSRGEVTDFGKLLDPLADSVSRISVFVAFLVQGLIPWWMLVVFIYRDSLISTMRTVCAYRGEVVAARSSGKIKAIIQATAIITILVGRIASALFPSLLPEPLLNQIAWWLVLVAAVYTFYSLYEYLSANWDIVSSAGRGKPRREAA
ncbi:MAG: CDP-diacylglycerol--glycerol-3-phosphate 3-phosphatidyltransferase [Candidatus Delongbacteria bacterium]